MRKTSINIDDFQGFEDEAPIELKESSELTAEEKVETIFQEEDLAKAKRKARMKEKPEGIKLRNKQKRTFKPKDYIVMHCNICEIDMQTARKDDAGNFEPRALCQHLVFKELVIEK